MTAWRTPPKRPRNIPCPFLGEIPGGLTRPPLLGISRMLNGRRPDSLVSSPAWLVVEIDTPVSRTVLGCDPWVVWQCAAPVDAPVMRRPRA